MLLQLSLCFVLVSVGVVIDGHALRTRSLSMAFGTCLDKIYVNGSTFQNKSANANLVTCLVQEDQNLTQANASAVARSIVDTFVEALRSANEAFEDIASSPGQSTCKDKALVSFLMNPYQEVEVLEDAVSKCYTLTSAQLTKVVNKANEAKETIRTKFAKIFGD